MLNNEYPMFSITFQHFFHIVVKLNVHVQRDNCFSIFFKKTNVQRVKEGMSDISLLIIN